MAIEITEQTKKEMELEEQRKFVEYSNKLNGITREVLDMIREKQLKMIDVQAVHKLMGDAIERMVNGLNFNFIINSSEFKYLDEKVVEEEPVKEEDKVTE